MTIEWTLVERLDGESMSIIAVGPVAKEWTSVKRITNLVDITTILNAAAAAAKDIDQTVDTRSGPRRLIIKQVLDYLGATAAMQVWFGPPDETPPPARSCAAINASFDTLMIRHNEDSWLMSADNLDGYYDEHSFPFWFEKSVRFNDAANWFDVYTSGDAASIAEKKLVSHDNTVLHDDGHLMNWVGHLKAPKNKADGLPIIMHDVTDGCAPVIGPLETLLITSQRASAEVAQALIAYSENSGTPGICFWLAPPPIWVARDGVDLIHPDDMEALNRARAVLGADQPGQSVTVPTRVRGDDGGWVQTEIQCSRHPGPVGDRLHVVAIRRTAS